MSVGLTQESVRIPCRSGSLAGTLRYGESAVRCGCLLAGPHPYMGGHQGNNVIETLAEDLADDGAVVLSFDYGGTGGSDGAPVNVAEAMNAFWHTGHAPQDPSLIEDVAAAWAFLGRLLHLPMIAIGYSFGAYTIVAARLSDAEGLVMICPTLKQHEFPLEVLAVKPSLVIYSGRDFATPRTLTEEWLTRLPGPTTRCCLDEADHFLREHQQRVCQQVRAFMRGLDAGGGK